jgi:hypothetical protein
MSKVMWEWLDERGFTSLCLPGSLRDFWCWNSLTQNTRWATAQGRLFYRDETAAIQHKHYSLLTDPIVALD